LPPPNTQRRPKTLPIHNGRTGKPAISARNFVKAFERLEPTADLILQQEHACIIRSGVDSISNDHAARKLELAGCDRSPFAAFLSPAQ
jgi:hypothetical protein